MFPLRPPSPRVVLAAVLLTCGSATRSPAQTPAPTDNPVASFYGAEVYPWTDDLPWDRVFVITDYPGANDTDRFLAAQLDAVAAGGGVVYFPEGTYTFTNNLPLEDGVILRGPTPPITSGKDLRFRPLARLEFPAYVPSFEGSGTPNSTAFKSITNAPGAIGARKGAVYLDLNRVALRIGGGAVGSGSSLIFGVRSNNVAVPATDIPQGEQPLWQRHSYRFGYNLSLFGFRDILIANNRVNDKHWIAHRVIDGRDTFGVEPEVVDDYRVHGYVVRDGSTWVPIDSPSIGGWYDFSYTDHYGVGMRGSGGSLLAPPPHQAPSLYYSGAVIRDNFIYATMRVKIYASGHGLVIKDNVLRDRQGKQHWVHATGVTKVSPANTLENRGIDWSGTQVLVEGNDVEVFRHKMLNTHYLSVDGEGILFQECCGGSIVDGVTIRGNTVNAYIGIYKQPYLSRALIEDNTIMPGAGAEGTLIYVVANTNGAPYPLEEVVIRNNVVGGSILVQGDLIEDGVRAARVEGNRVSGNIDHSPNVDVEGNLDLAGAPLPASRLRPKGAGTTIAALPEVRLTLDRDPATIRPGELVRVRARVINHPAAPVQSLRLYNRSALVAEWTSPEGEALVVAGAYDLWTAVATQPTVATTFAGQTTARSFSGYRVAFATPDPAFGGGLDVGAWLTQVGLDPGMATRPEDLASDTDGDGVPLLAEYAWGLDPASPDRPTGASLTRGEDGSVVLALPLAARSGVRATLEAFGEDGSQALPLSTVGGSSAPDGSATIILPATTVNALDRLLLRWRLEPR